MQNRPVTLIAILPLVSLLSACQTAEPTPTELEGARTASDAYLAYARGDCVTARTLSDPETLELWPFNEMRHSMLLIQGFCREQDGEVEGARDIYRSLVLEAPTSFAADDAAERTRVLKLMEQDPEFAERIRRAKDHVDPDKPRRTPIDRVPVEFPPLAKATRVDGYVVVEFAITQRGTTEDPFVVDSRPPYLFDGAALRAVRQWQYMREGSDDDDNQQLIRILFKQDDSEEAGSDDSDAPGDDSAAAVDPQ
jgi:TonB family protein